MTARNPATGIQVVSALAAVDSTTGNATGVSSKGFGYLTIVANPGTTGGSVVVKLQEDDAIGGSYSDIAGATLTTVNSTLAVGHLELNRPKEFIRAVHTGSGLLGLTMIFHNSGDTANDITQTAAFDVRGYATS